MRLSKPNRVAGGPGIFSHAKGLEDPLLNSRLRRKVSLGGHDVNLSTDRCRGPFEIAGGFLAGFGVQIVATHLDQYDHFWTPECAFFLFRFSSGSKQHLQLCLETGL